MIDVGEKQGNIATIVDDPAFWEAVEAQFVVAFLEEAERAARQGVTTAETYGLAVDFDVANRAVYELVGSYMNEWWASLSESTREAMRAAIRTHIETGSSIRELQKSLAPIFGKARAKVIATTEVTRLFAEGNRIGYQAAGVEEVEWRTVHDSRVDPLCEELDGQTWTIGEEEYVPPRHPNCRCQLVPVVRGKHITPGHGPSQQKVHGRGGAVGATVGNMEPWEPELHSIGDRMGQQLVYNSFVRAGMADAGVSGVLGMQDETARGVLKDKVVKGLAERSGLPYETVNDFVYNWTGSSDGPDNLSSTALQLAVAEKFGIKKLPAHIRAGRDRLHSDRSATGTKLTPAVMEQKRKLQKDARTLVDTMYDDTQKWLKERNIKQVPMMRGSGNLGIDEGTFAFNHAPLSSWTVNRGTVSFFGQGALLAYIPASRIISTPFTGLGCLHEFEMLVVGGPSRVYGGTNKNEIMRNTPDLWQDAPGGTQ